MKNVLVFSIALIIGHLAFGQDNFDYDKDFKVLLALSKDSTNTLFYPSLLDRFNNNDSTLTDREVVALMIGFTDNVNYKPYKTISEEREIMRLIEVEKYEEAIAACNAFLANNPLNFSALIEKGFAYMKLSKDSSEFHKTKFLKILDAVLSTGDGSKEKPFFVLNPGDGQVLIRYIFGGSIGMMGSGSDKNGNFLDILEMKIEGKEPVTLYFHINHATNKMFSSDELEQIEKSIDKSRKKKGKSRG
jgi:hypothetical protein